MEEGVRSMVERLRRGNVDAGDEAQVVDGVHPPVEGAPATLGHPVVPVRLLRPAFLTGRRQAAETLEPGVDDASFCEAPSGLLKNGPIALAEADRAQAAALADSCGNTPGNGHAGGLGFFAEQMYAL